MSSPAAAAAWQIRTAELGKVRRCGTPPPRRTSRIHRTIGMASSGATCTGAGNRRRASQAAARSPRPLQRYIAGSDGEAGSTWENHRTTRIPATVSWSMWTIGEVPGTTQSAWCHPAPPWEASAR
jgi:hypothetical protein